MSVVDQAFAALPPELWTTPEPAAPPSPVSEVRRRLRLRRCPSCGGPPAPRKLLCERCRARVGYCPTCERVAPLSEFDRPTASDRRGGIAHGAHHCTRLDAAGRAAAARRSGETRRERWAERLRERRIVAVAAVLALGGPPGRTGPEACGFWRRAAALAGEEREDAVRHIWRRYGPDRERP